MSQPSAQPAREPGPAGQRGGQSASARQAGSRTGDGRPGNPYLAVLRLPGALGFSAAGFLARMPMSMFGLGTVLLIAALTHRYGLAGAIAAAGSVSYAAAAPQVAKLADRFGQHRVLRPLVAVFATATAAFLTLAELHAPLPAVAAAAALAGATMPSIGSMVRARWSTLLAGTDRLHTAFSLESVADEIIFVVGPAVVTLLATDVYPAAGVAAAAAACLAGTLIFAAQRRTEPEPRGGAASGRQPVSGPGGPGAGRAGRLAAPGLGVLVPVYWFMGAMFATVDLSTVAFSAEHRALGVSGLVLGTYALGSAAGGLWYGARHWHAPLDRRFALTLAISVAGVALLWFQPGMATLFAVIFAAGLTISPTLIAGYGLVEEQAPEHRRTEGMTWLSSAISVGVATGSPIAGRLIDAYGARWGYVFAAGCGAAAVAVTVAGLSRLRPPAMAAAARRAESRSLG